MPRYDVTLDTPTSIKGTLIEVPPVGGIENGSTVEGVVLTEEMATFLSDKDTGVPGLTLKKSPEKSVDDVTKAANRAKTFEELDALAYGEERSTALAAIANARDALAAPPVEETLSDEPATTNPQLGEAPEAPQEGGE